MSIIGKIAIEIMTFNNVTKEELCKIAKHSCIKFSFYYSYIIEFDKANVGREWYTLYEIKKYIRNYFNNDSNINLKSNNK